MGKFFLHEGCLEIVQMEVAEDKKLGNVVEGEGYPVLNPAKDCVEGADLSAAVQRSTLCLAGHCTAVPPLPRAAMEGGTN